MRNFKWTTISIASLLLQGISGVQIPLNKSIRAINSVIENQLDDLAVQQPLFRESAETDIVKVKHTKKRLFY
jgi:hypothetical protein